MVFQNRAHATVVLESHDNLSEFSLRFSVCALSQFRIFVDSSLFSVLRLPPLQRIHAEQHHLVDGDSRYRGGRVQRLYSECVVHVTAKC